MLIRLKLITADQTCGNKSTNHYFKIGGCRVKGSLEVSDNYFSFCFFKIKMWTFGTTQERGSE